MKRNACQIASKRGRIKDIKRHTWCCFDAFESMYQHVYEKMVEAKVAVKLDVPVMYNRDGIEVTEKDKSFGLPTLLKVTDPKNILFVDETGKNTNMKTDGGVGGRRLVVPANAIGNSSGSLGSTTDIHFTVLCFTCAAGEAVMCAIIFKSEKKVSELPLTWKFGIDIRRDVLTGTNERDSIMLNYGEEYAMRGGPKCLFKNKQIPCFVGASPQACITSEMLAEMLAAMDSYDVFDRSEGKKPFLLLDRHHSRFELPFLDYIVNPKHEWQVCIGVPYGTHLWQVGDSEAQNGSFSIAITKAKEELFKLKPYDNKNFSSTNIIPLINMAWPKSFGRKDPCRRAIAQRGWNPLNYSLLLKPEILKTKPINTGEQQHQSSTETVSNQQVSVSILTQINTTEGTASDIVDLLVIQEIKNRGRTDAIRKRRQEAGVRNDKIKMLATGGGRLTSGMLGVHEHYSLDIDVRNAMSKYYERKEKEEKEKTD